MSVQIVNNNSNSSSSESRAANIAVGILVAPVCIAICCWCLYLLFSTSYASWFFFAGTVKGLAGIEGFLCFSSLQALCGLITGLCIGCMRALLKLEWRFGEQSLGALFSPFVLRWFPRLIKNYREFLPQVLVSILAGYVVGIAMNLNGLPYFYSHTFTGAAMMYLSGGGGSTFVESSLGFLLFAIIILAICIGTISGISFGMLWSLLSGAIGSGIKGGAKAVGVARSDRGSESGNNEERTSIYRSKVVEGAFAGFTTGLVTGIVFAMNARRIDLGILLPIFMFALPLLGAVLDSAMKDSLKSRH